MSSAQSHRRSAPAQRYASFFLLKVYRFSTGDFVLGKYPGKQSPFVTGLCGSRAASVIRQQSANCGSSAR
jgi:hypothetical protein